MDSVGIIIASVILSFLHTGTKACSKDKQEAQIFIGYVNDPNYNLY